MSESTHGSGSVKLVLTIGFVMATLMVIGFGGVFLIMKYQDDQDKQAAAEEEKRKRAVELGTAARVVFDHLANNERGDSADADAVEKAAATAAEFIRRKVDSSIPQDVIDSMQSVKEGFEKGPPRKTETDGASADPEASESDALP